MSNFERISLGKGRCGSISLDYLEAEINNEMIYEREPANITAIVNLQDQNGIKKLSLILF